MMRGLLTGSSAVTTAEPHNEISPNRHAHTGTQRASGASAGHLRVVFERIITCSFLFVASGSSIDAWRSIKA
jgi:hypothetical protein